MSRLMIDGATAERTAEQPTRRIWLLLLAGLVILGGAIRAGAIVDRPLWEDESYTWKDSQLPYHRLVWWKYAPHQGPLGYLAVKHSVQLFGTDAPWALRMPSLLCGMLCIPAAFWLGRIIHGPVLGLMAAALVAVDPNMVDQSQQARMYTMFALAWLLACGHAICLLRAPPERHRPWIALGLLLSLLIYVNFAALAFWAGLLLAAGLLCVARQAADRVAYRRQLVRGLTTAYTVAALVSIRGLYRFVRFVVDDHAPGTTDAGQRLRAFWDGLEQLVGAGTFLPIAALLAIGGLLLLARHCRISAIVVAATGFVGAVMVYRGQSVHDVFAVRYFTVLQPALWIGLAALPLMLKPLAGRQISAALLVVFCLMQGWQCAHLEHWNDFKLWRFVRVASAHIHEARSPAEQCSCSPKIHLGTLARYYDVAEASVADSQPAWMMAFMHNHRAEGELRSFLQSASAQFDVDVEKTVALCKQCGHVVLRLDRREISVWEYDAASDGLKLLPRSLRSELARAKSFPGPVGDNATTVR